MPSTISNKSQERAKFAYSSVKTACKNFEEIEMKELLKKESKKLKRDLTGTEQTAFQENNEVDAVKNAQSNKEKFRSHIKDVPMMIMTNGLAAAFAFVFSKQQKDQAYHHIENITKDWLKNEGIIEIEDDEQFHEVLIKQNPEQYRRCTREIMALYTWLKRYADGLISYSESLIKGGEE